MPPSNKLDGALLADLAVMLAGQRLSPAGMIQPVLPNDLQAIYQRLRDTIPDFFLVPDARLREWHQREQAPRTPLFNDQRVQYIVSTRAHQHERAQPNSLSRLEAAIFHAEWLAKHEPHDAEIGRKIEQLKLLRTPPRDPAARQELIDLSNYYSYSLELMDSRGSFQELPRGVQRLAGTEFDIRGVVWLGQGEDKDDAARGRTSSRQILIDRRCSKLHFLLASEGLGFEDGMETGHIIFHYTNGTQRKQPLIYGRQLRDYWCLRGAPREASDAVLAWEGSCAVARERGVTIRLFKFTWTNPEPDAQLSQVDLETGEVNPRPFVVAITAE